MQSDIFLQRELTLLIVLDRSVMRSFSPSAFFLYKQSPAIFSVVGTVPNEAKCHLNAMFSHLLFKATKSSLIDLKASSFFLPPHS